DGILTFGPNATVRNFIVNAVGTSTVAIRIHRHDRLDSVELTPSRLTLRQSEGNQLRFSVLAVFKDHVSGTDIPCVADISQHPGLRWSITPGTGAALTPDQSGFVVPLGQNATGSETVGLTLPADLLIGAPSLPPLTATIQLAPAWDTPLQDALRPIAGPGFGKINDIPNFVILPDGFANRTEFSDAALGLIDKVRELGTLAPWNMFLAKKSDAMNFWLAWVPSPDEGGNEIGELYRAGETRDRHLHSESSEPDLSRGSSHAGRRCRTEFPVSDGDLAGALQCGVPRGRDGRPLEAMEESRDTLSRSRGGRDFRNQHWPSAPAASTVDVEHWFTSVSCSSPEHRSSAVAAVHQARWPGQHYRRISL